MWCVTTGAVVFIAIVTLAVATFADSDRSIRIDVLDDALLQTGLEMSFVLDNGTDRWGVPADELVNYFNGSAHPLIPPGIGSVSSVVCYWIQKGYDVTVSGWDYAAGGHDGPWPVTGYDDYLPDYAHHHCLVRPEVTFDVDNWGSDDHWVDHSDLGENGDRCSDLGSSSVCTDHPCPKTARPRP